MENLRLIWKKLTFHLLFISVLTSAASGLILFEHTSYEWVGVNIKSNDNVDIHIKIELSITWI